MENTLNLGPGGSRLLATLSPALTFRTITGISKSSCGREDPYCRVCNSIPGIVVDDSQSGIPKSDRSTGNERQISPLRPRRWRKGNGSHTATVPGSSTRIIGCLSKKVVWC